MREELSEQLAEMEVGLSRFESESLSCLEATKLSYIQAVLERAKTSLAHDSMPLASMLIEKAQRAFHILEIGFKTKKESAQTELCQTEESDRQIVHPAKQFSLLKQEIQTCRFTFSNSKDSESQRSELSEQQSGSDLQSFKQYQDMFEKMALDRLLAKVMKQIPENAGPLNPERLVIRSFQALQDISPEYLSRLISYYESLLTLQTVNSTLK